MNYIAILFVVANFLSCITPKEENRLANNELNLNEDFVPKAIEIPYLAHQSLKKDFENIQHHGRLISLYSNIYGEIRTKQDFNPSFRVAWNEKYLLIRYEVIDDLHVTTKSWKLWQGDALALFFGKEIEGSRNFIQEAYSIEANQNNNLRTLKYDFRKSNTYKSQFQFISNATISDTLKVIEIAIPFQNFDTKGTLDDEYNLQLIGYDYDIAKDEQYIAYPFSYIVGFSFNPWAAKKIKLVEKVKEEESIILRAFQIDNDSLTIVLYGKESLDGRKAILRDTKLIYFEETIKGTDSSLFTFTIPLPKVDENYKTTALFVDDEFIDIVDLGILPIKHINTKAVRYEDDIRVFQKQDRLIQKKDSIILFLGSSTIRRWESLENDFEDLNIVNRAFGGSIASDINLYIDKIVIPHNPYKIVYYEGDNDIYFKIKPTDFIDTCKVFVNKVREKLPNTEIILVSIKPSPARKKYWPEMLKANSLLKSLADTTDNVSYLDITNVMFDSKNQIIDGIWENDKLHMNQKGYDLWKDLFKQKLYSNLMEN